MDYKFSKFISISLIHCEPQTAKRDKHTLPQKPKLKYTSYANEAENWWIFFSIFYKFPSFSPLEHSTLLLFAAKWRWVKWKIPF